MISIRLLLIPCLLANGAVSADNLQVIISGRAIHEAGDDLNENNYGVGLQYDFAQQRHWIPVINFASLKDSNRSTSRYIGAGIKRRFKISSGPDRTNFDIGALGLVMRRPDYNDNQPFLGAIPFVSLSNDWGGINATYVPKMTEEAYAFWYFQFTLKLMQF